MNSSEAESNAYTVFLELKLEESHKLKLDSMWADMEKFQNELSDFLGVERGSVRITGFSGRTMSPVKAVSGTKHLSLLDRAIQRYRRKRAKMGLC